MTFAELKLHHSILKGVDASGYTTPTPIQELSIPVIIEGRDIIATAQTGTGKTAAFVLPALERLTSPSKMPGRGPRVLVLAPTRELAAQVMDAAKKYGRGIKFRCGAILGGMPYREQLRLLSAPVDMIVATPGRLLDHLERGSVNLERLEMLILDEADRMLDMGFSEDMEKIVSKTPSNRQTLMFTATMESSVLKLAERMLRDPHRIELAVRTSSHALIEQRLHVADNTGHKKEMLRHILSDSTLKRAIIFSGTKRDADALAFELNRAGHPAAPLHGDMNQNARNRTIEKMRRGGIRVLVATDVAARGLDVNGISHVINFDLPRFAEDYVHRIGRTGRAGASGVAISFVSSSELSYLERIERFIGKKLPEQNIEGLAPLSPLRRVSNGNGARRPSARPAANSSRFAPKGSSGKNEINPPRRSSSAKPSPYGGIRKRASEPSRNPVIEYRRSRVAAIESGNPGF